MRADMADELFDPMITIFLLLPLSVI